MDIEIKDYRWPSLSPLIRQMIVVDDQGRYGIAHQDARHLQDGVIIAHPIDISSEYKTGWRDKGPILLTNTVFNKNENDTYTGIWFDCGISGHVKDDDKRHLTIICDLGYLLPEKWADIALAGSEEMGHWDYGATLGKIGGEPPVKRQKSNEMTVEQAADYAKEVGEKVSRRGIRLAARTGHIPGARKAGRDWLLTYEGFNHYLDNRPRRGPKPRKK